jgi:hypothetical protein
MCSGFLMSIAADSYSIQNTGTAASSRWRGVRRQRGPSCRCRWVRSWPRFLCPLSGATGIPVKAKPVRPPLRSAGYISHQYADHVWILKFIEHNWNLPPVTRRRRDNFSNPVQLPGSYAPLNTPALNDLFDCFDFFPGPFGFF